MRFPQYQECRDSGHIWLGNVPKHWALKRLGHYFEERRERASDTEFEPLSVTKLGIVPRLESAAKTQDGDNRKKVLTGDFVINSRSDRKGSSGLSPTDGSVSLICTVLIPDGLHGPFVHHLLRSELFQEEYYRWGKGIVADLWSTNFSDMKNIVLSVPSDSEQTQIARFLDHETARIDALIEEQQRLIELLREKRQAVISHAVTKGLDPTVPMKDSGVEWLGEVPAHWIVSRVKNIASFITSGPRGWSDYIDESGEDIFLQSGDMDNRLNVLFDKAKRITTPEGAEGVRTRLQDGDVVVCITGANTGRVAVLGEVSQAAYVNQHLGLVRPYKLACNSRYLGYALSSSACQTYFNIEQYGLKEGLSLTDLAEAPLMVPPLAEQAQLVDVIENQLSKLDRLTADSEMTVELLRERRSALISAAVTGKIDVRGWQPPAKVPTPELAQEAV